MGIREANKMKEFFEKLFDDKFTTNDVYRILALLGSLALVIFILQPFRAENTALELQLNPLYSTVTDSTVSHEIRAVAIDKLTKLEIQKTATSYWQKIFQSVIMIFVFTVASGIVAYSFSRIKWTKNEHQYEPAQAAIFKELPGEVIASKIISIVIIFATVLISGSLIFIAQSL